MSTDSVFVSSQRELQVPVCQVTPVTREHQTKKDNLQGGGTVKKSKRVDELQPQRSFLQGMK